MIFAFCAAVFCVLPARGEDVETARAAARSIASASQQSSVGREQRTNIPTKSTQQVSGRTAAEDVSVRSATPRASVVAPRATTSVQSREISTRSAVAPRSAISTGQNLSAARSNVQASPVRFGTGQGATQSMRGTTTSRAAVTAARAVGTPAAGYKVCRETFFQCMDEFCANKNAQLKRCACSSRVHEFDNIRKTLDDVEEKMLDFNERLLAVNMDKEDAVAMSSATEGEKAFATDDKSESQSILDGIMKKLQSANTETATSNNLSTINLSMDANVFDTIDSDLGIQTTTKEGEDLYNAALPTCLEMATEVCTADEIPTAQNAYVAAIEQDCNTVSKTYTSLKDKAVEKVREGGALLEMSRLNNQQTRNADDILTCKKKMLDALTDSAVCGENLGKCLDWSGRYINPSTGSAILTSDLTELDNMIRRPTGDEKWAKVGSNDKFVTFLGTKKKYIEPAMKNCEGLESVVWTAFLEDALAQIKLAQGQKLEDMRQSCTTITTECMTNASGSLVDFDSRALSVFGVYYDKNVNQVCSQIKNACTALINHVGTDSSWGDAIGNITTTKTLDQIVTTCTEVGKNCIIRNCMNLESKFGLCQSQTAIMRTNILNHNASNPCWDEVSNCVASTGTTSISKIMTDTGRFGTLDTTTGNTIESFLDTLGTSYTIYTRGALSTSVGNPTGLHLWCNQGSNNTTDLCRITERIWGNCTDNPAGGSGTILQSGRQSSSLLAWFASNTNSSCNGTACNPGEIVSNQGCALPSLLASDMSYCPMTPTPHNRFNVVGSSLVGYDITGNWDNSNWTNCCTTAQKDEFGNCCMGSSATMTGFNFDTPSGLGASPHVCTDGTTNIAEFITAIPVTSPPGSSPNHLVCVGGSVNWNTSGTASGNFPNGDKAICSGKLMILNTSTGLYLTPDATENYATASYNIVGGTCVYGTSGVDTWTPSVSGLTCNKITGQPTTASNDLFISY